MGRPAHKPNLNTRQTKDHIQAAFKRANKGGQWLDDLFQNDKGLAVALLQKTIPNAVDVNVSGTVDISAALIDASERMLALAHDQPITIDNAVDIEETIQSVTYIKEKV